MKIQDNPRFHFIIHVRFRLILHYWGPNALGPQTLDTASPKPLQRDVFPKQGLCQRQAAGWSVDRPQATPGPCWLGFVFFSLGSGFKEIHPIVAHKMHCNKLNKAVYFAWQRILQFRPLNPKPRHLLHDPVDGTPWKVELAIYDHFLASRLRV